MTEIVLSPRFRKAFKRKFAVTKYSKRVFEIGWSSFKTTPSRRDLRLTNYRELDDLWSFSIDYDVRVIFSFVESSRVLFIDIGTHEELY